MRSVGLILLGLSFAACGLAAKIDGIWCTVPRSRRAARNYGLETSMDVEFTVDVVRDKSTRMLRVGNNDFIIALGIAGSQVKHCR